MMNKTWIALLLALALTVGALSGCTTPAASEQAATPASETALADSEDGTEDEAPADEDAGEEPADGGLTLTDMAGRQVSLEGPAQRVVALMPADCEILFTDALAAGHTLVGRGEYCDWPAALLDVPAVQSGNEMNLEEILALEPDVVIMSAMAQTTEQVEALEKAGVAVVVSDAQDIAGVYTAIELLGAVVGREAGAKALVADMQTQFEALEQAARDKADGETPTVYFEASPLEYGLWTAGSGTFMDEIAAMLGLENIFADVTGWAEVSQEQVIQRNPDYIVTTTMYFGDGPEPVEELMGRDGWENVTAVANGGVFNADSDRMTRPGPRLAEAASNLYEFVYGE